MFLFTVLLSLLFVNPKDLSDDLLQGGDCIENIPAGKPTRRYIRKWVLFFSCLIYCLRGINIIPSVCITSSSISFSDLIAFTEV